MQLPHACMHGLVLRKEDEAKLSQGATLVDALQASVFAAKLCYAHLLCVAVQLDSHTYYYVPMQQHPSQDRSTKTLAPMHIRPNFSQPSSSQVLLPFISRFVLVRQQIDSNATGSQKKIWSSRETKLDKLSLVFVQTDRQTDRQTDTHLTCILFICI